MKTLTHLVAGALAVAGPTHAETIGSVTAAFDAAEQRTFHALVEDGESQSFWMQLVPGSLNMSSFSIWANPTEDGHATSDVLILSATLIRTPDGFTPMAELIYLEDFFNAY